METREPLSSRIATALVRHAARHAPGELAGRLGEEWLADLAAQAGALQRLRFALGCLWARQVLARDPLWARAPVRSVAVARSTAHAAGAAGAPGAFDALLAPAPSPLSRRTLVLLAIVALHVGVIAAFVYGVAVGDRPKTADPMTAVLLPQQAPTQPPPPAVKPTLRNWTAVDPLVHPQFEFKDPVVLPPVVVGNPPAGTGTTGAVNVRRVPGGPGPGFPSADEHYPAQSIRLEETGVATVQVCVDARGRLTAAPVIAATSGSPRLDGGALELARAGSGHYRSATEDGQPVAACFPIRVRFALRQ